jgi:hypothetical protein
MKRQLPLARDAEDRLQHLGSWKGGPDVEMETVLQSTPSSQIHQHAADGDEQPVGVALLGRAAGTQVGGAAERLLPIGTLGERRQGFAVLRDCWRSTRPNRFVPLGLTRAAHPCFAGRPSGVAGCPAPPAMQPDRSIIPSHCLLVATTQPHRHVYISPLQCSRTN